MTTEAEVAPVAATENPATEEPAQTTPVVADPESSEAEQHDDEPKDEADPRDKAVKSLTRRVDRVTAARYQAEARAAELERQVQAYAQRLTQYEQPEQTQQQQVDPVALAKEIAKIEKVTERANGIAADGKKRFGAEFGSAVQTLSREAGAMFDQYGRPTGFGEAVLSADDPTAVINYLGSDPDLAAELADLTPIQQARRILKIENELGKPKEPIRSNAPKPITPVKSAMRDDGGVSDNLSIDEWIKRRNKQALGR